MAATFNEELTTNKDWVRLLIGDTNTSDAKLQDETIVAILADEGNNKYCAAVVALRAIAAQFASASTGLKRKVVDDLQLEWSEGASWEEAFGPRIAELKARCKLDTASATNPYAFKAI